MKNVHLENAKKRLAFVKVHADIWREDRDTLLDLLRSLNMKVVRVDGSQYPITLMLLHSSEFRRVEDGEDVPEIDITVTCPPSFKATWNYV